MHFAGINRILVALSIGCCCGFCPQTTLAEPFAWAIVASNDPLAQSLGDLLTAATDEEKQLLLVEREKIRTALRELQLNATGLVAEDRRTQLGKILAADALLFIQPTKQLQPKSLHITAVETRTGLQFLSLLESGDKLDQIARKIATTLVETAKQLRKPDADRLYVSVVGIHNEEPSQLLTPIARALTSFLIHDLQDSKGVFVLERERLRQLTSERDLTGIDLALKSSTRLIEVGFRRDDVGNGYRMTVQHTSVNGQLLRTDTLQTKTANINEVRNELFQHVLNGIGTAPVGNRVEDAKLEAQRFAILSQWLLDNGRIDEARDNAECAFALDATVQHCRQLHRLYGELVRRALTGAATTARSNRSSKRQPQFDALSDALVAAMRCHELDLFWLQSPIEGIRSGNNVIIRPRASLGLSGNPFEPHVPRWYSDRRANQPAIDEEPVEVSQLRQEYDDLRWRKYRWLTERAQSNHRESASLAIHELRHIDYFATSAADYVSRVLSTQKKIDEQMDALQANVRPGRTQFGGVTAGDVSWLSARNVENLARQLESVYQNRSSSARHHPQWSANELLPLWNAILEHRDPKISALGCLALTSLDSHRDRAIRRALEVVPQIDSYGVELCARIRDHLHRTDELEAMLEDLVARAEKNGHPGELTRRFRLVVALFQAIGKDQRDWHVRVMKVLNSSLPPQSTAARDAAMLRELLTKQVSAQKQAGRSANEMELTGAWTEYSVRIIRPQRPSWGQLIGINPVLKQGIPTAADDVWVYFLDSDRKLIVGRMNLAGDGDVQVVARISYFLEGQAFRPQVLATGDRESLFVVTGAPGLAKITLATGAVDEFSVDDGFVGEKVASLAALNDKVFLGLRGGIAEFDISTKRFRLLASSSAVDKRGPLDGGAGYSVDGLLADPRSQQIYFVLQAGIADGRNGLWSYSTTTEQFQKAIDTANSYPTSNPTWHDGQLFLWAKNHWQLLSPVTNQVMLLTGYAKYRSLRSLDGEFVLIGDHVLQRTGQLYTPDGKIHDSTSLRETITFFPIANGIVAFKESSSDEQVLVFTRKR